MNSDGAYISQRHPLPWPPEIRLNFPVFCKVTLVIALSAVATACQQAGSEAATAPTTQTNANTVAANRDGLAPAPIAQEAYAVPTFRAYCFDTKSDPAKVQAMIAAQGLQRVDEATNGYTKVPQRGTRQIFRLPGSGAASNTFDLVVSDLGVCGLRVRGPAAESLEGDVVAGFQALMLPAPQPSSVKAGVFIPYGKALSASEVREHGLVNTMTSTAAAEAVVVYIPPAQAVEVLNNAGMR